MPVRVARLRARPHPTRSPHEHQRTRLQPPQVLHLQTMATIGDLVCWVLLWLSKNTLSSILGTLMEFHVWSLALDHHKALIGIQKSSFPLMSSATLNHPSESVIPYTRYTSATKKSNGWCPSKWNAYRDKSEWSALVQGFEYRIYTCLGAGIAHMIDSRYRVHWSIARDSVSLVLGIMDTTNRWLPCGKATSGVWEFLIQPVWGLHRRRSPLVCYWNSDEFHIALFINIEVNSAYCDMF